MAPRAEAPRALAVRAMGALALAGGALAATTVALPPPSEGSETLILVVAAASAIVGAVLLSRRPVLGEWGLGALGLLGTALITIATREGGMGGGGADNEILYLWVALYSFYFLSLPNAVFQMFMVGAGYAWVLSCQGCPTDTAVTQWVVTMTTLVVAGLLVRQLRASLYRLVDDLSDRASRDSLTGLLNRHSLDERYAVERARSERDGTPISVLTADIDEFKALNDTLGHPTGDRLLRQVSAALRHWTRELDASARIGGDEFAVVMPGTAAPDAISVAQDLREAIARTPGPEGLRVTVSIGVSTAPGPAPAFGELWQAADAALYEAKHRGGDRVCFRGMDERAPEREPERRRGNGRTAAAHP